MGGGARDGGADRWPLRKQVAAPPTPAESLSVYQGTSPRRAGLKDLATARRQERARAREGVAKGALNTTTDRMGTAGRRIANSRRVRGRGRPARVWGALTSGRCPPRP